MFCGHPLHCRALKPPRWMVLVLGGHPLHCQALKPPMSGGFRAQWPSPSLPSTKTTHIRWFSCSVIISFITEHWNHPHQVIFVLGGHPLHYRPRKLAHSDFSGCRSIRVMYLTGNICYFINIIHSGGEIQQPFIVVWPNLWMLHTVETMPCSNL